MAEHGNAEPPSSTYRMADRRVSAAEPRPTLGPPTQPVREVPRMVGRPSSRWAPWVAAIAGGEGTQRLVVTNNLTAAFFLGVATVAVWAVWISKVLAERAHADALAVGEWTWRRGFKPGSASETAHMDKMRREAPPLRVKTYRTATDYEADAPRMMALGYTSRARWARRGTSTHCAPSVRPPCSYPGRSYVHPGKVRSSLSPG